MRSHMWTDPDEEKGDKRDAQYRRGLAYFEGRPPEGPARDEVTLPELVAIAVIVLLVGYVVFG